MIQVTVFLCIFLGSLFISYVSLQFLNKFDYFMQKKSLNQSSKTFFQQSSIIQNSSFLQPLQNYSFQKLGQIFEGFKSLNMLYQSSYDQLHLEFKVGSIQQRKQDQNDKNSGTLAETLKLSKDKCIHYTDLQINDLYPIHSKATYEQYKSLILNLTEKLNVKKTKSIYQIELRNGKDIYQMEKHTWIRKEKENGKFRTKSFIIKQHFFRIQIFKETLLSKNCNDILKKLSKQKLSNKVCIRIKNSQTFMVSKHIQIVAEDILQIDNTDQIIQFIKRDPAEVQKYGQYLHTQSIQNQKALKNEIEMRITELGTKYLLFLKKQEFTQTIGRYLLFLRCCLIKINYLNPSKHAQQLLNSIKKKEN